MYIDLFEWAYIPSWLTQLENLATRAMPEPWGYSNPLYERKNATYHILEKYVNTVFRCLALNYISAKSQNDADAFISIRNDFACFHTGLLSRRYRPIYAYFEKSKWEGSLREWTLMGFTDSNTGKMKLLETLPFKPFYQENTNAIFHPDWDIRVNVDHILDSQDTRARIPQAIRHQPNLSLILEVAALQARRMAAYSPSLVVPQIYQGRAQLLLPLYFLQPERPDLTLTVEPMDGYYIGNTVLNLEMAYSNARLLARPTIPWLSAMVE